MLATADTLKNTLISGNSAEFVQCLRGFQSECDESENLQKLKDFLSESLKVVSALLVGQAKAEVSDTVGGHGGETFLVLPDTQFHEPRGRFKTTLSTVGMHLEGKTASCFVTWDNITHAVTFPAYQTTKKEGEDLVVLRIEPGSVKYNGKDLKCLLWNLGKSLGKPIKVTHDACLVDGTESVVVTTLLQHLWGKALTKPRPDLFQTIAIKDAKPYLLCYKGTQEGAIYPLECGVVFIKPTIFLPAEQIASLTAGRGGGSGQTRYVDLKIETADDEVHEFTNIERDQLPALQGYVKGYLEMRKKAEEEAKRAEKAARGEDCEDDDSEDEDEDFDPDADDDDSDDSDESSDDNCSDDSDVDTESDAEMAVEKQAGVGPKQSPKKGQHKVYQKDEIRKNQKKRKAAPESCPAGDDLEDVDALMRAAYQSSARAKSVMNEKFVKSENDVNCLSATSACDAPMMQEGKPFQ